MAGKSLARGAVAQEAASSSPKKPHKHNQSLAGSSFDCAASSGLCNSISTQIWFLHSSIIHPRGRCTAARACRANNRAIWFEPGVRAQGSQGKNHQPEPGRDERPVGAAGWVTHTPGHPGPGESAQFFADDSSCPHPAVALNRWFGCVAAQGELRAKKCFSRILREDCSSDGSE